MRLSMIRTHLWPSLSEMSGWLKSSPVCEVSQWPINNPSPQHGGSYTSKNNDAATWISCLDSVCDPEHHLYAFAASIPATPDYHFTPNRQRPAVSLTLDSVLLPKTIKIRRNVLFIDQEKRLQVHKQRDRRDVFMLSASYTPAEDISLSCSLCTFLSAGTIWILFLQHASRSCTREMRI